MSFSRFLPAAIAAPLLLAPVFSTPAEASPRFSQQRLDQSHFVMMAAPDRQGDKRRLVILEELGDPSACWKEQGSAPTVIDPIMLDFDSRGLCDYRSNAGGYSIRVAGNDLNWYYQLKIIEHEGNLLLLGQPETKGEASLLIGRSEGAGDFAKIELLPGWKLTQRMYEGKALKHLYLTTDQDLAQIGDPTQRQSQGTVLSIQDPTVVRPRWNAGNDALTFGQL